MKSKFFSPMWRVAVALVMVLSLGLVMAAPVAADVSGVTVDNDPQTIGREAEYTIDFTTTQFLSYAGSATITITFPVNTTVPASTAFNGKVTVNDTTCPDDTIVSVDQVVTVTVPKDIPAGAVEVVIDAEAGIVNPTTVDTNWKVQVKTSAETTDIDSVAYSTTAVEPPEIIGVAGTAYQNSNDTIVITFSEEVDPDGLWSVAFPAASILCGTTELNLTGADFSPAETEDTLTLTITLNEAVAHLVTGTDNLKVTPAGGEIANVAGDAHVAAVQKIGSVSGDSVAPAVALGYSLDRPVLESEILTITATFSEDMVATPTITIVDAGSLTLVAAEVMTIVGGPKEWYYDFTVPAGSDGEATVTISGTDLAGNANQAATNNTFVIDNTAPVVAVTGITGSTTGADTIAITFSEDVVATGDWDAGEVEGITLKKTDADDVIVILAGATYAYEANVLTITLAEAGASQDYLLNGYTVTFDPGDNTIDDLAGNPLDNAAVDGTAEVTGDLEAPTITGVVGVSTDTIQIAFSELAVAADGTWSANEFSIESPAGAPLNINHAVFSPPTAATTVLTIVLDTIEDNAVLVAGEVICVTPATDAVVDLAGNSLAAVEVSSGADSGWLEAWVDDSWTGQADVSAFDPGLIWDANAFDTIQEGVAAVAEGGTVNVRPGDYEENLSISTKGLTLQSTDGPASTTIDGSGTPGNVILITAADVVLGGIDSGFTIKGVVTQPLYTGAVVFSGADCTNPTVQGNIISSTQVDQISRGIFSHYDIGFNSNVTIKDNIITSTADVPFSGEDGGMFLFLGPGSLIDNNEVSGFLDGISLYGLDNAVYPDGWANPITVSNNVLHDNTSAGIGLDGSTSYAGPLKYVVVSGNDCYLNPDGILMWGDELDYIRITGNNLYINTDAGLQLDNVGVLENVEVFDNNIYGNTNFGIDNNVTGVEVTAENNWWGTAVEAGILPMVDGDVDYNPWLDAIYPHGEPTTTDSFAFPVVLATGWNLISLPLIPEDSDIDTVLADLIADATVEQVRTYDQGIWPSWARTGEPPVNLLTDMADGQGFWVQMNAAGYLAVSGYEKCAPAPAVPPAYDVVAGWNLIGFKFVMDGNIEAYLGDVFLDLQAIYGYDASSGFYFIPADAAAADANGLRPGCGYWIALTEAGTIYPVWAAPSS